MDTITFDKLLLKTAFCCMASDGHLDKREVELIKSMCMQSPLFVDFNFEDEINSLVTKLNSGGDDFIRYYFSLLKDANLSEEEELSLIDFAINTIKADEQIEYSEIKFFKVIRAKLKVSNEKILAKFPDIELFLEEDIITESYIERIKHQYFETVKFPQFEFIQLRDTDPGSNEPKEC
jgi:uncharacterized tellurite resistance protein B-like protein